MKKSVLLGFLLLATVVVAEEGMWTLDHFPSKHVLEEYGVAIDEGWLDQVQRASVRVEGGCSGSFVSPDGLVLTNHHCVSRCLAQMTSAENDVEAHGFYAEQLEDEIQCQAEQLSVLMQVEEITEAVAEAIEGLGEIEANEARKQIRTHLEKECEEKSDGELKCESVSLYHGGQYFLYGYKRYEDVRMVFAPEEGIANFGGDPDNFNFPRWCLDMSVLRAYEDGKPAKTPNFLQMRADGPDPGEPVFVSGHPGGTSRLLTVAELEYYRNVALPHWLARYFEFRGRLIQFGKTGEEEQRISHSPLQSYENSIKVQRHRLQALMEDSLMAQKRAEEQALRDAVAADPELQQQYGSSWDEIADAIETYLSFRDEHQFIEQDGAFNSYLYSYARNLVQAAEERQKPDEQRYREYRDTALQRLEQRLLAARPIYPDLEIMKLSFSLDKMREFLGPDSLLVQQVLGHDSPDDLAEKLVSGTQLADPEVRRELWDGGSEAVAASKDPMIQLVLSLDNQARALRKRYEDEVEAPWKKAEEKIARARFAAQGTSRHPDATFTLRVSFGTLEGWKEEGEEVYPFTMTQRLFERATGKLPFRLPETWIAAREELDPDTRFNQTSSTDVIGGNSGSPLIDAEGRLIGLIFDGNIHAIGGNYWFDEEKNRTISVHPAIMLEALEKVYGAERLLGELTAD